MYKEEGGKEEEKKQIEEFHTIHSVIHSAG